MLFWCKDQICFFRSHGVIHRNYPLPFKIFKKDKQSAMQEFPGSGHVVLDVVLGKWERCKEKSVEFTSVNQQDQQWRRDGLDWNQLCCVCSLGLCVRQSSLPSDSSWQWQEKVQEHCPPVNVACFTLALLTHIHMISVWGSTLWQCSVTRHVVVSVCVLHSQLCHLVSVQWEVVWFMSNQHSVC